MAFRKSTWEALRGYDWHLDGWVRKPGGVRDITGDEVLIILSDADTKAPVLTLSALEGDILRNENGNFHAVIPASTTKTLMASVYWVDAVLIDGVTGSKDPIDYGDLRVFDSGLAPR